MPIETTRDVHDEASTVIIELGRVTCLLARGSHERTSHDRLSGLLVPMIRRAVRTGRGPAALLPWIRSRAGDEPLGDQNECVIRTLAEDLARILDPSALPARAIGGRRQ